MGAQRGDFAADRRVLLISMIAALVGVACAFIAWLLLRMIAFITNLFFFQTLSFATVSPAGTHLGRAIVLVPVIGGLIVGLMARFGSDKIRGHGIPEALEAILFGKSRMDLKVAILKPLSSGIVIGSGGPFGAEGPIIMTGGAFGSLVAQNFHLTAAERKTLLVALASAIATRMAVNGVERLAVVGDDDRRRLIGIVSRSDLVNPSARYFEEEEKRERLTRFGGADGI